MAVQNPRDEAQAPLYQDGYPTVDEYTFEPGVCILPIAEGPPEDDEALKDWSPVVVARLHAPYRVRHSQARARKTNNPPVVPMPDDTGKFVFISGTLHVENTLNTGLNTFDWYVQTDYVFVENCPSRVADGFVLTGQPWTWQTTSTNAQGGVGNVPAIGAISDAGVDAKIGYNQGQKAVDGAGNLVLSWGYNSSAFYPGVLMSSEVVNGGPTISTIILSAAGAILGGIQ